LRADQVEPGHAGQVRRRGGLDWAAVRLGTDHSRRHRLELPRGPPRPVAGRQRRALGVDGRRSASGIPRPGRAAGFRPPPRRGTDPALAGAPSYRQGRAAMRPRDRRRPSPLRAPRPGGPSTKSFHRVGSSTHQHNTSEELPMVEPIPLHPREPVVDAATLERWDEQDVEDLAYAQYLEMEAETYRACIESRQLLR